MKTRLGIVGLLLATTYGVVGMAKQQRAAQALPSAQFIQSQLDALPRCSGTITARCRLGGTIELEAKDYNLGTQPLYIGSCVTLRGAGECATRLIYHGKGAAVRFSSYADHKQHQSGTIEDLSILSDGDGIAMADNATNEGSEMAVRRVAIDCEGIALNLRQPNGTALYFADLDRVNVVGAGGGVLDFKGVELHANRLMAANNTRKVTASMGCAARVAGSGLITNSRFENDWGGPALQISGNWTITSTWIECVRGAAILSDAHVMVDHTSQWFAQPKQPLILQNGSTLHVAGFLGWTDNGGMRNTTVDQCYRVDASSKVFDGGRLVVGKE